MCSSERRSERGEQSEMCSSERSERGEQSEGGRERNMSDNGVQLPLYMQV